MADREEHCPPPDSVSVAPAGTFFASTMEGDPSQKPSSKNEDVTFMIYRRFGHLIHYILRQRKHKVNEQQKTLKTLPRDKNGGNCQFPTRGQQIADREPQKKFLTKIEETLQPFCEFCEKLKEDCRYHAHISSPDSFILNSEALKRAPPPGAHHYQSIRAYLRHGPPIYMDYCEIQDSRWHDYEAVVEKILQDPETARWLNGPLDPDWGQSVEEQLRRERGETATDDTTWLFKAKRKLHCLVPGIIILFWIFHITAVLAYPLLARNATLQGRSELGGNFSVISLLVYWYLPALGIVVQGLLVKGVIYARKVFLGGILTCFGGFYILYMLMGISAASSCAAIPSLFTIVLLLIRTM